VPAVAPTCPCPCRRLLVPRALADDLPAEDVGLRALPLGIQGVELLAQPRPVLAPVPADAPQGRKRLLLGCGAEGDSFGGRTGSAAQVTIGAQKLSATLIGAKRLPDAPVSLG
jgi:hypothetical protein